MWERGIEALSNQKVLVVMVPEKKTLWSLFLTDIFNNPFTHKQLEKDIRFSVFPGLPGNVSRQLEIFP